MDPGERLFKEGKYEQALRSYKKALKAKPDPDTQVSLIHKIIDCLCKRDQYLTALGELSKFERLFSPGSIPCAKFGLLMAKVYSGLGNYDEVLECSREAYQILRTTNENTAIAKAQWYLGLAYLSKGDLEEAKISFEDALSTYRRLGDKDGALYSINRLSHLHFVSGRWNRAAERWQEGLRESKTSEKEEWTASFSLNLGMICSRIGDWPLAAEYLRLGIEASETMRHVLGVVRGRLSLAFLARVQRSWGEAVKLLEKCRQVCEKEGYRRELCLCYEGLGEVGFDRGNYAKAKEYYSKALNIGNEIAPEGDLAVEIHRRLGELYFAMDNQTQCLKHCDSALRIARKLGDRFEEACTHRTYALIHRKSNEPKKARQSFTKAIHFLEELGERYERARTHLEFSRFLKDEKKAEEALGHLFKAEELFGSLPSKYWVGVVELEKTRIELDKSDFDSAVSSLDRAQDLFTELGEKEAHAQVSRLREEVEKRMVKAALLNVCDHCIPEGDLQELIEDLANDIKAERAFLVLSDDGNFETKTLHNIEEEEAKRLFTSLNGLKLRKPLISTSFQLDDRFPQLERNGILSLMLLPFGVAGAEGVLYIDKKRSFSQKELTSSVRFSHSLALKISELRQKELKEETHRLKRKLYPEIITRDKGMLQILSLVDKIKDDSAPVLIEGETGTGKELIARAIHYKGKRGSKPFIPVDCGVLTETLAESTLFGHKKGAFTDAKEDKPGFFEEANGGTLFLDEISNLSPKIQSKLLRVLEEKKIRRLGDTKERRVDVRIIAASNKNLEKEIKERRFRKDLYYRLRTIRIHLPPLRERRGDISLLAHHFMEKYSREKKKEIRGIEEGAMEALIQYNWEGNVRDLKNEIERAIILTEDGLISSGLLSIIPEKSSLTQKVTAIERQEILRALTNSNWVKRKAARRLNIPEATLRSKIKKYNLTS